MLNPESQHPVSIFCCSALVYKSEVLKAAVDWLRYWHSGARWVCLKLGERNVETGCQQSCRWSTDTEISWGSNVSRSAGGGLFWVIPRCGADGAIGCWAARKPRVCSTSKVLPLPQPTLRVLGQLFTSFHAPFWSTLTVWLSILAFWVYNRSGRVQEVWLTLYIFLLAGICPEYSSSSREQPVLNTGQTVSGVKNPAISL